MAYNVSLNAARSVKNDEFYTRYEDIEREMEAYLAYNPRLFHGKTVLLPCDDYKRSNFVRYFSQNFSRFGLAGLAATSYQADGRGQCSIIGKGFPIYGDTGQGILSGDGDFRSDEISSLRDCADFVITNPPFSLFREFIAWCLTAQGKFICIGPSYAATYKKIFQSVRQDEIWLGATHPKQFIKIDGQTASFGNISWFTNVDHKVRNGLLKLQTMEDNLLENARLRKKLAESYGEIRYPRYVNYDAIEVPFVNAIPSDYRKAMGVPTTFLDKYNPDQFEIIGTRLELAKPIREVAKVDDWFQPGGRSFYIRTGAHELTRVYDRIVIRAKRTWRSI